MKTNDFSKKTIEILREIRKQQPVIHHITNYVVMNSTANITLAIGASPIMAHTHEELDELSAFSRALNLNIGTLEPYWVDSMLIAGRAAAKKGIPIILDPVGSGATTYRTETVKRILEELPVTVIRGNASEIMSLFSNKEKLRIRGVDSLEKVESVREEAFLLAKKLKKVIAITGPIDYITDGEREAEVHNGHPMFGKVTGTGCAATTAISCFCAVEIDPFIASVSALGYYGLAGEEAVKISNGPGTFQAALYDALHNLSIDTMIEKLKIRSLITSHRTSIND